ncbi:MAG: MBL fold metallo-hydrolase [Clostridia bacterium]|nr:MBL fold metallo-hydrolase [Clostridia bacterium]
MKLTALQYGKTTLPESMVRVDGDPQKSYPISLLFFLLETEGKRILIDTGCDTMKGFVLLEHESPVQTLEHLGISPQEITHVILTHAHHDHADGVRYYPNATVFIHQAELPQASAYLTAAKEVVAFTEAFSPASGVTVRPVCGHSDGSCVVELTTHGKPLVLCGDECYHKSCFSFPHRSGGSRHRENTLAFFERYGKDNYQTILFHDPELVGYVGTKVLYEE